MKLFNYFIAPGVCTARVAGASLTVVLGMALVATSAQAASPLRAQWRATISSTELPGPGCFTAAYPDKAWTQVACSKAPDRRYDPASGPSGFTVGNGHDYAADVTKVIKTGVGSFPSIRGLTSETNEGVSNQYSLQLNSQFFDSPVCKGNLNCFGWQQFIYAQQGSGGNYVFMQYWLINYGNSCPGGWTEYSGSCYRNSNATSVPTQSLADLHDLQLTGSAAYGGNDVVKLTTLGHAYSASGADTVVDLGQYWDESEYNIFGDGNGSEADFNSGTKISVKVQLQDGLTTAPRCFSNAGTTGETNNLNLGTCAGHSATSPYISFTESN